MQIITGEKERRKRKMAIYHCSVKIIGRSVGKSSVAAAAYRSATELTNQYDGVTHDFTNKNWVEYTNILLCDNAPAEYKDRSTLWNSVELAEKSKDAQLAREFEVALPKELPLEIQIDLVNTFIRNELTSKGMCADVAIHNPPVTNDRKQPIDASGNPTRNHWEMTFNNIHAHILATVRPIKEDGSWDSKSQIEYLCKRGTEEKAFTADEYKVEKNNGWSKQYQYYLGKGKAYYTPEEAEMMGLQRVSRTPKTTRYGRKNPLVEKWNSEEQIYEWRKAWEDTVNNFLDEYGFSERIDCRSFEDQGRTEEIPSVHMGVSALNMEKRANREFRSGKSQNEIVRSELGEINRHIWAHNKFHRIVQGNIDMIVNVAEDLVEMVATILEMIRILLIGRDYYTGYISKPIDAIKISLKQEWAIILNLEKTEKEINHILDIRENQYEQLKNTSVFNIIERNKLKSNIEGLDRMYEQKMKYIAAMYDKYNVPIQSGRKELEKEFKRVHSSERKIISKSKAFEKSEKKLLDDYKNQMSRIKPEDYSKVQKRRTEIRPELERELVDSLKALNEKYYADGVLYSKWEIDEKLEELDKKYKPMPLLLEKENVLERTVDEKVKLNNRKYN